MVIERHIETVSSTPCDDNNLAIAYFSHYPSSDPDDDHFHISLARFVDPEEDDGLEIEMNDQVRTAMAGITRCVLTRTSVFFEFTEKACKGLRIGIDERELRIKFDISNSDFDTLLNSFKVLFEGHKEFTIQ